jgi:rRNA-processing protein FCF1
MEIRDARGAIPKCVIHAMDEVGKKHSFVKSKLPLEDQKKRTCDISRFEKRERDDEN